ncbi:amino acid adenylation domain-containing protein [Chryseobacterium capnotolerans]|uniref:non-ribosomal peptide synthetase n=1 Tax=Chryseobacterium capnotolerans TaxID=2759528 RepID=UPI0024B53E0B|nr:non-ribosomal peptide synthetase [Chryseobacterium capnotolerans]UHO38305.1 amino acid adenylation domain-containing protein [Chryseobacterium capnotolerans]
MKLTPYQSTFYNEWILNPSRSDYNIIFDQSMSGYIDIQRLNSSLVRFVNNNLLLNSNVVSESENLVWKHRPLLSEEAQILTFVAEEPSPEEVLQLALQPFDLEKEQLARFYAIKLNNGGYRIIHIFSHILVDGLSANSIYAELSTFYNDLSYVNPINLTEQEIRYEKLRNQLEEILGKGKTKMSDFWKSELEEVENIGFKFLQTSDSLLFGSQGKDSIQTNPVSELRFHFPESVSLKVRQLISKYKLTPYTYGQLVFAVLLHRISGVNNLVINYPVGITEGQDFIFGAHINTILKGYRFETKSSLQDLIHQNIEYTNQLKTSKARYLPIEELISYAPTSNILEFGFVQTSLKDVVIHYEGASNVLINNDLNVDLVGKLSFEQEVRDGQINYKVRYANQKLDAELISNFVETYQRLFIEILEDLLEGNADKLISQYNLLNENSYQKTTESWNTIDWDYQNSKPIHKAFEDQVIKTPENTALVYQDVKLTYQELNERSNRLANYLINTFDLKPDELVPLCLERSENMLIAILAVLKAGAAYVPMDPSYPVDRIEHILKDTGARIILAEDSTIEKINHLSVQYLSLNDSNFRILMDSQESSNPVTDVSADRLAYVIYTSGTTGLPKGVMVEHQNVMNVVDKVREAYGFSAGEKITAYTSYVFDVSVSEFFNALLYGNELHVLDEATKKDADLISRYLLDNEIAYTYLPPVMLSVLPRVDYPSVKGFLYAGEPCDYETGKYWSEKKELYNLYGPTEATIYAIYKKIKHGDVHVIGKPVGNSSAYILDGCQQLSPVGAVGELYLGGIGIARGYLNRPDLTEERFIKNPFQTEIQKQKGVNGKLYKTGDLVRWLPDGNIEYIGRNDFQVKIRGYRIELGEIEERLAQHPEIKQSVVLAKENNTGMKYLAGYYVAEEELNAETLTEYLSETLPEYMVPSVFVQLTALPLTINGKLDRKQLPEPEFSGEREYTGPENELQEKLCQIYSQILGIESGSIGIHDDFFRLGGNSIMAIKLISKIKQELEIPVNVSMVFGHKTVASLSHVLDKNNDVSEPIIINAIPVSQPEEQRLSFAQERLWFIESYEGSSSVYNVPMVFTLRKNVSQEVLQQAFDLLMQRHEVLRSIILTTEDGVGYQEVTDQKLKIHFGKVETRTELDQAIDYVANKVFRLDQELPISASVFRMEDNHYLSVVIHHIAFDGWSTEVFINEFNTIYQALIEGENPELPVLPIQYKDFALWQRNYLSGEILKEQVSYWKNKLEGFQTLDLPLDFKRPAHVSYTGATTYFDLSEQLASELQKLSKDLGVSLYSVMLSGYYLMLSAYSGQDDIIVGSPVANRHHAGLENIIGFFVNTFALRETIDPEQQIKDFIVQVSESITNAQSHQDLPFEKLVEEMGVEQDNSRNPIFQVMFGIQSFEEKVSHINNNTVLLPFDGDIDYKSAKFDVTMMIDVHGDNIRGIFNYAVALFKNETIIRMKETYMLILKQLAEIGSVISKNNTIKSLQLLNDEHYQKITKDGNAKEHDYPEGYTIHRLFEEQAAKTPDATALVYQNIRLSYQELNERANRLANHLIAAYDVKPDDLIPMCLDRSENMLVAILGVLKAGAAYVPMDPQYPSDRIQHILQDTQAKVVLTEEKLKDKIDSENAHILSLNNPVFQTIIEEVSSQNPVTKVTPENLSYIIYTSGTTGMPKGVMIEHQNVVNVVSQIRDAYGFSEGEKITAYTSYVFDVSVSEFFNALLYGNELHILDEAIKKDADSISQYLLENDIAYAYLPPVMLSVLPKIKYPSLKGMLYAGEPCDYETGKYWSEYTRLYNLYGPTEATIYATYKQVEHGDVYLIGRPVNNTSAYVLDTYYRPVPIGAIGELYLGGNGIARGYLNRPDLTSDRFIVNPFQTPIQKIRRKNGKIYKTGDLVRLHPDGNIEYIGRNDFQVKIRGYRIELGEIENKLQEYKEIKQAVILAKENKAGMKFLVGYYVSDEGLDETHLSAFLSETLPEYMIPAAYVQLDALPLTINGKLDRGALPEPEFTGTKKYTAPQTELQEKLCRIYGEILGLDADEISIHDDFFRLGGNSIMAIKLISKIKNYLNLRIQVTSVFNHKTIASLAYFLETEFKEENIHIEPVMVSSPEDQRLSFAQERLWFIEAYEGGSSAYNIPMVLTLSPDVQLEELQKSLETVILRHEVLRSVIKTTAEGIGYQMVIDSMPEFRIVEVNTREELETTINSIANKVFRLEEELPLDITLLRLKDQYYLSVVVHHIAFDGWSVDIVLKEIQAVYEALINKIPHQLPDLAVQYKDFALWQRNYLKGEILDKQINYWKGILEDFESLNLPLDFKRPAQISYEGAAIYFDLSLEVASGLRAISRDLGVSLYSVMLGGYYLMLSAYSGQDDIIVGSPISNRHHAGLEDIVGFFVNTLALRGNVNSEQNFKNFILQVSQSVAEAQSHQDLPFEKLVEELGVEQDMSRHPVFQVMFGVQSFGRETGKDNVFSLFEGEIDYQAAKFDLTTMIDDGEEKIRGMFNYAVSLFSKETILRMKDTYVLLLEQIAAIGSENAENIKINDFQLLKNTDYKTVIENWNNTVSEYPFDKTIHQLFEDQVVKTPDHTALVYQDIQFSYQELNEKANQLANDLIGKYTIQPDEIIPLCLDRSENMLIAMLGVLKSGGAYVPIDPSYPSDRIRHIIKDTKARLVIGQESTIEKLKDQNAEYISLDEVQYKAQLEIADSNNPVTETKSGNLAYVIYTSGTTGLPKGVMVEHRGVSNLVTQFAEKLELNTRESATKNCLWYANYVFDAHVAELFPVITHGHSIYLLDKERQTDIAALQHYIRENDIRIATIPPVLLTKDYILPLEKLMVAGDVTNPQLMALYQAQGIDIINAYGPTEGTVCATLHYYKEDNNPLNIGKAIGNMTSYVLDDKLRPVPVGAIGELYIGGAGITRGYLNRPELTEERFMINPFQSRAEKAVDKNGRLYKTGDLVRWLSNGELEYLGRNDFQVKIRGYRIELGEIENTLVRYPDIRQTAVLAKENNTGLKYLAGYYVADSAIDSQLLSEYVSESLPEYMVPGAFVHLESLPLTINGKLDKKQLPEPEFTGSKDYIAPETELQSRLCQIYSSVLGIDAGTISIHDDFFRLGGDSIISIQLVGRIRQQLDVKVSVKEIFTSRTPAALSLLIEENKKNEQTQIVTEQGLLTGEVSLLPVQEWFFSQKEQGYLADFNHWNQAFLVNVPELDKELLEESIRHLIERHDAFRLKFEKSNMGYIQSYGNTQIFASIKQLDASALNKEELSKILTEWQSGFDIEQGPLYQIGYIYGYNDGSARLYFAFHHLIIDAVSWRIITEDIKNIYQALEKGDRETILSHTKGSSYRQWVNAVKNYCSEYAESRAQELLYWTTCADTTEVQNKALDQFIIKDSYRSSLILNKEITEALIRNTHHIYQTQINDLLLSALSVSLSKLTGEDSHAVLLESHGREEVFQQLDITETMGWFTTMFPLLLKNGKGLADTIILTKESLRRVPHNGIGYGSLVGYTERDLPKISFNYLGQLDQETEEKSWFIAAEDAGSGIRKNNRNSQYISMNGAVVDGQLRFEIEGYLPDEQIKLFTEDFKTSIETIVETLSQETQSYLTPSDVDYVVDFEQLTEIQKTAEIEGVYLANSLQEGFVYHALNQGEKDDAYRVQLLWDYHTALDIESLKKGWSLTQAAYPSLRMRFDWNGEIVQVINKNGNVDWRYQDISEIPDSAQETFIKEITTKDRFEGYDLSKGDLFRVYLFKRSKDHYTCLFSNHHAILDGWSIPVVLNSIHTHYLNLTKGKDITVVQDQAYTETQKYLRDHKETGRKFWDTYMKSLEDQEDLSGLIKESQRSIDLATYRHIQDHQQVKMMITGDQYDLLKAFIKSHGLTVNAILQYLWHQQLRIYSGLSTTVVGTTVSGRSLPVEGIESSAGLYINTLPLIVTHEEERVVDHIKEIQNRISDINTHSDINLAELHHDGRRIFSSLFVFENYPVTEGQDQNELGFVFKDSVEKLDYPLGIVAFERGNEVSLTLNYEGYLFDNEMMAQVIEGMQVSLNQVLENENITSSGLQLLAQEKYKKITEDWNNTWYDFPSEKTIHELFEKQVAKTPDHIALIFQDRKLLYSELNARSNRLAHYLISTYNLQPDELVPLCLERSENMIIAILAVWKAGAAYVPMDPSYPADRIKHILTDTGARVVLAQESTENQVQVVENVNIVSLDNILFKDAIEGMPAVNPTININSGNLAYAIYTSGTTGLPKGVMVEHKNVVNLVSDLYSRYGLDDQDVILQFANYVFDPSVEQMLLALLNGNSMLLSEEKSYLNEEAFIKMLNDHKVSYINLTPSVLQNIDITQVKTMRKLASGGEALTVDLYNKLKGEHFNFLNCYGPTEVTVTSIVNNNRRANSIGRPIGNTSVYVLDAQFRPVPVGAAGELYIGGSGVSRGYLNRPDLTDERFIFNPFQTAAQNNKNGKLYKTGDLVRWLPDGNIEYIGRNDFQVKIRGYRIELEEIENRLLQHPEIRQVAVLAKENNAGMKYLAGYYVADSAIDSHLLSEFLSETLPEYMIPAAFVHLIELPISINGKLDRKQLPEPTFIGMETYTAPVNELQQKLAEVYAEVLGLDSSRISIHDDFFRLGGNSIMAIKLISKIKQVLEVRVEVATIFSHKTVASLSEVVSNETHTEEQTVITPAKVNSPEEQRLSFAQERLWFIETYEGGSSAYNIPMAAILDEKTDISVLQKAFEKVIKRHEILRSVIKTTEDGVGYQQVTDHLPEWNMTEVSTREDLDEALNKCANKIFRLEVEIPIATNIFKFENRHYLSAVIHHIAFDGWSTDIFLKEIQTIYKALLNNEKAEELSDVQIQYKDYALWQREYLSGQRLEQQINYWKDQLEDFQNLDLPTDFRRPSQISYEGENLYFSLDEEQSEKLRALSKNLGISLYSVMLGGYYLMLSAYSGQDDIVVGSPIANRHHAGLEDIIGFFVNTLALREKLDAKQNLKDFLLQVSKSVTDAQSHQDLPFEKLVEELGVEQDTSRHPVFQVMFGLQNFGGDALSQNNQDRLFYPFDGEIDYQVAKFDLTTMIDDGGDEIKGMFNYAKAIFSKETVGNMIRSYEFLLEQMTKDEDQREITLSDLNLVTHDQYKKLTEDWNATYTTYPSEITIHHLFENQVKNTPDQTALVYQNIILSYQELNQKANQLAHYLIENYGLQPDDLVPVCLERSENILIAILAILKSGAAYVPMDPSYPSDRIQHILNDTEAKLVIGQESTAEKLENASVEVLALDDISLKAELEITSTENPVVQVNADNLAYVIYTSGTTGLPKGVMIEHSGVINLIESMIKAHRLQEYQEVGCYSNYVFDAFVYEAFPVLCNGNTLWLYSNDLRTSVGELNDYIKNNNIEVSFIPPVLLREVVEHGTSLKLIFAGGESFPALDKNIDDIIFVNEYGPTEGTVCATLHYYKEDRNPLNIEWPD